MKYAKKLILLLVHHLSTITEIRLSNGYVKDNRFLSLLKGATVPKVRVIWAPKSHVYLIQTNPIDYQIPGQHASPPTLFLILHIYQKVT